MKKRNRYPLSVRCRDEGRDILLEAAEICSEVMDMSEYTSMIHKADRKIHRLENYRRAFNEYADSVHELENRMSSRFRAMKNEYEEMKDGKWEQIADMLIDRSTDISEILHNDRVVKADDSKDMDSWYERIQKQDEQIKKAKEKFVKVVDVIYLEQDNPAYVLECDWDDVDEFLWRNPDDISDIEYLAFVDKTIKVDELIESIEKGDLAIVEKFTKWYGDVGKKEYIEPYREKL